MAHTFCHDLDFVNSLPVIASQLHLLGLCPEEHLYLLKEYCRDRAEWFSRIIDHHRIPPMTGLDISAKDVAKALLLRILHGGVYESWVKEFNVYNPGGAKEPRVAALEGQLARARQCTVQEISRRYPAWHKKQCSIALEKQTKKHPYHSTTRREQAVTAKVCIP